MASDPHMEVAVSLMKRAIDRAVHETDGAVDWLDIFGSEEQMLYWLDDSNFEKANVQ